MCTSQYFVPAMIYYVYQMASLCVLSLTHNVTNTPGHRKEQLLFSLTVNYIYDKH